MLKRRLLTVCCVIVFVMAGGISLSYSVSKRRAQAIAEFSKGPISPLKGQLVLFIGDDFVPCWIFRGEYNDVMTGATFDVFVSLFGNVLIIPYKEIREEGLKAYGLK